MRATPWFWAPLALWLMSDPAAAEATRDGILDALSAKGVVITSWNVNSEFLGEIALGPLALEGRGQVRFRELVVREEAGRLAFTGSGFSWRSEGGGEVLADRISGTDLSIFPLLVLRDPAGCAGFGGADLRATSVSLIADPDLLPHTMPPERIQAHAASLSIVPGVQGCPAIAGMTAETLYQETDGYRFTVGTAGYEAAPTGMGATILLDDPMVSGPQMEIVFRADEVRLAAMSGGERPADEDLAAAIGRLAGIVRTGEIPEGRIEVLLRGLSMPLALAVEDRLAIPALAGVELPEGYRIDGDFRIAAVADDGTLVLEAEQDMAGLFALNGRIYALTGPGDGTLAGFSGGSGTLGLLSSLRITGCDLRIEDRGLDGLIRTNTGKGLTGHLADSWPGLLDRLPGHTRAAFGSMSDAVQAWAEKATKGGAAMSCAPARAVSLLEVATLAAVSPARGIGLLGITEKSSD